MKLHVSQTMLANPLVELPCAAGTAYKIGQALVVANDVASLATGATKPEYICQAEKTGTAGETVQAIAVLPGEIYEAALSEAGSSLKVGDKVTIATDGIRVTATTVSGVAKIVEFTNGTKNAGDPVLIKFD